VRVVEHARVTERILLVGLPPADDSGHQTRRRLEHHQRRDLPARDDVVADRNLLGRQALGDALVNALVPPADQHQPGFGGELADEVLVQPPPGRREQESAAIPRAERLDRREHRLGLEDHPRPAAVGLVVHLAVLVDRVVTQVVHAHVQQTGLDRPPEQALAKWALEDPGEDRDDVDPHHRRLARPSNGCHEARGGHSGVVRPGISRTTIRFASRSTSTITSLSTGTRVSTPSSSMADQTSFAAVWITSRTVPSA